MAIELYWGSGSPFAWRVMLALEWKRIPYASKLISFSKGEHKAPGFMAMNPRGKVPVLKDGELTRIDKVLATADWLVGDKPSAADLWWYPETMLVERAGANAAARPLNLDLGSIGKRYPAIGRWQKRIEAQPGYAKTYPPHWKQAA